MADNLVNKYNIILIDNNEDLSNTIKNNCPKINDIKNVIDIESATQEYVDYFKTNRTLVDAIMINTDGKENLFQKFIDEIYNINPKQNVIVYSNSFSDELILEILNFEISHHFLDPTNPKLFDFSMENIQNKFEYIFYSILNTTFTLLKNNYFSAVKNNTVVDESNLFEYKSIIEYINKDKEKLFFEISLSDTLLETICNIILGEIEESEKEEVYHSIVDEMNNIICGLAIKYIDALVSELRLGQPMSKENNKQKHLTQLFSSLVETTNGNLTCRLLTQLKGEL